MGTKPQPYTVMTVCTGNICRSPMAEIILRHEFEERGLGDRARVESSGVSSEEHGNPIDRRAVKVLREHGYDIPPEHFAHRITPNEIAETNLFLPMTASHMGALMHMLPLSKRSHVFMYRSFDPNLPDPQPGRESDIDLVDPWYGGQRDFEIAIDQIEEVAPSHSRLLWRSSSRRRTRRGRGISVHCAAWSVRSMERAPFLMERSPFACRMECVSRSASRSPRRCGDPGSPAMRSMRIRRCLRRRTWHASPSRC